MHPRKQSPVLPFVTPPQQTRRKSAKVEAAIDDLRRWARGRSIDSSAVKFADVTDLILRKLGEPGTGPMKSTLRTRLKSFVTTSQSLSGAHFTNDLMMSINYLPSVLKEFCKVGITMESISEICWASQSNPLPLEFHRAIDPAMVIAMAAYNDIDRELGLVARDATPYRDLARTELIDTLVLRDMEIDRLRVAAKKKIDKLHAVNIRVHKAEAALQDARTDCNTIVESVQYRRGLRNVSVYGGYSLALGRNRVGNPSRQAAVWLQAGTDIQWGIDGRRHSRQVRSYCCCWPAMPV